MHNENDPVLAQVQAAIVAPGDCSPGLHPRRDLFASQECAGAFAEGVVARDVLAFVMTHPGCSQRTVERALAKHRRSDVRTAVQEAAEMGLITRTFGRGRGGGNLRVVS